MTIPFEALVLATVRVTSGLSMAAVTGCALTPCPPFRAAWYLDDEVPLVSTHAPPPTIVLALLNAGADESNLTQVVVNPTSSGSEKFVFKEPVSMMPGELRMFDLKPNKLPVCVLLPVTVQIHCVGHSSRTQAVSGALPNYLHRNWLESCPRIKAASP